MTRGEKISVGKMIKYYPNEVIGECVFLSEAEPRFYKGLMKRRARFRCKCGNTFESDICNVKFGTTRTCGCLKKDNFKIAAKTNRTHGLSKTKFYRVWRGMKERCYNVNNKQYPYYGGRGISVCDRWINSFENFHEDMFKGYGSGLSIERIDVNGNYCPNNCKWATDYEQARNRTDTWKIDLNGEVLCAKDFCQRLGLSYGVFKTRVKVLGWTIEEAVSPLIRMTKKYESGQIIIGTFKSLQNG